MDDILIATQTMEEHRRIVHQVLQILESNQLFLKPESVSSRRTKLNTLVSVYKPANSPWTPSNLGYRRLALLLQTQRRPRIPRYRFYRRFHS